MSGLNHVHAFIATNLNEVIVSILPPYCLNSALKDHQSRRNGGKIETTNGDLVGCTLQAPLQLNFLFICLFTLMF